MYSTFKRIVKEMEEVVINILNNNPYPLTKRQMLKELDINGTERAAFEYILTRLKQDGYLDKRLGKGKPKLVTTPLGKGEIDLTVRKRKKTSERLLHKVSRDKVSKKKSPFLKAEALKRVHDPLTVREEQKIREFKGPSLKIGLFLNKNGRGRLISCHRKDPYPPVDVDLEGLPEIPQDYVVAYRLKPDHKIHIEKVLGSIHDPKTYSLMAIYSHQLRHVFSSEALKLAQQGKIPPLDGRTDLRNIPLVTIDGENAKDFDDAVWAAPDLDPRNSGGWKAIVAIADVAYYVRPDDALDQEAHERGNSVYFADRVVSMLPEALSNELCSLKPDQDRACLAVEMVISKDGKIKSHRFKRGLMRSKSRLTYTQVQKAIQGDYDETTGPLWPEVLQPLYGAYQSLLKARRKRGTLDLNVPERKVIFNSSGQIAEVIEQERFESHQLIEELMIAANVCSAETLLAKRMPTLFRVHDLPEATRVENLKTVLKSLKIQLPRVKAFGSTHFQTILNKVQDSPYHQLINDLVLRSQAQANYSPHNGGHFGLSLTHYCHFTSPIRRYADLIVHRGLIATLGLGHDGQDYSLPVLEIIGQHISQTERQAAQAEREVNDRLITAFLETHIGEVYHSAIVGVTGAGIFVSLNDNGAEGFISKSRLPWDFYRYDEVNHRYVGQRTKKNYQLGQSVIVRLEAANPISCSTTFSLLEEGTSRNRSHQQDRGQKDRIQKDRGKEKRGKTKPKDKGEK